jgi:hypothetical protein
MIGHRDDPTSAASSQLSAQAFELHFSEGHAVTTVSYVLTNDNHVFGSGRSHYGRDVASRCDNELHYRIVKLRYGCCCRTT